LSTKTAELIDAAFENLSLRPGFVDRSDQRQLSLLISDCISGEKSGAFEAPTGLGKSLAGLIPAIANAIASGKRTVVATYTNVLAEQYWRKDLPLALSLFDSALKPKCQFLIGRQRYACLAAMDELSRSEMSAFKSSSELGIEAELRVNGRKFGKELTELWQKMAAPPVCPGRLCSHYGNCYYYNARRGAEKANVVITNHSVVIQDALLKKASDGEMSMLGDYDCLIIDEAHDFAQAAMNSLEFELSESKLGLMAAIALRLQSAIQPLSLEAARPVEWNTLCDGYREAITGFQKRMGQTSASLGNGILRATPHELFEHPQIKMRSTPGTGDLAQELANETSHLTLDFVRNVDESIAEWQHEGDISKSQMDDAMDAIRNYSMYLKEFAVGCHLLFAEDEGDDFGVGVTYVSGGQNRATLVRRDVIGLSDPLRDLIWRQVPTVSLSATLAVDGNFDFYKRMTGAEPDFEDILPTPFDFATQASLYLPKPNAIPDPTAARKNGTEEEYFNAVALELSEIIAAAKGRTLALFHSKREMEAVHQRVVAAPDHPIYMQWGSSAGWVGERFKKEIHSSLFAVRSFWTGFDAPGETLSCVVLVRVPFEVPVDPPAVARMAWLQTQGMEPFAAYSLPNAKMLIRQGAGRLVRTAEDVGVIALLDPRVRTKNYGDEILKNLPTGMRTFDSIEEALGSVGLLEESLTLPLR
jgi:ATP-dependent DNA helicase DinG